MQKFDLPPLKWRSLSLICTLIEIAALFLCMFCLSPDALFYKIVLSILLTLAFANALSCLVFWRCPECRRILPIDRMWMIHSCPFCGEHLYL